MEVTYQLERQHRIMRAVVTGPVDDAGVLALYGSVGAIFQRSGARAGVLDFSGATEFTVSSGLIDRLSHSLPALPGPETPRFIVAPQPHVYGAMRRFQSMGEPTRPRLLVVRSAQEVYDMLEISAPKFEPLEK